MTKKVHSFLFIILGFFIYLYFSGLVVESLFKGTKGFSFVFDKILLFYLLFERLLILYRNIIYTFRYLVAVTLP